MYPCTATNQIHLRPLQPSYIGLPQSCFQTQTHHCCQVIRQFRNQPFSLFMCYPTHPPFWFRQYFHFRAAIYPFPIKSGFSKDRAQNRQHSVNSTIRNTIFQATSHDTFDHIARNFYQEEGWAAECLALERQTTLLHNASSRSMDV